MKKKYLIMLIGLVINAELFAVDEISSPFVGVTHIHRMRTQPRTIDMHILIIDLNTPGISFCVTPANGDAAGETNIQTVRDFLIEQNAQIAINAGFFFWDGSGYDVMGFAASQGNIYSPFVTTYDFPKPLVSLNISADNVASIIKYNSLLPPNYYYPANTPIYDVAPGSERIVYNGANVTSTSYYIDTALHPRTAGGVTKDNKLVLITVDGRNPGHSNGMYTTEVAKLLIEFGVVDGINFDGGGSTTLVFADPNVRVVNIPVGINNEPGSERATANNIAVFADQRQQKPVKTIFNDFEGNDEGALSYAPGYSGSTQGIVSSLSTADAFTGETFKGSYSQKIVIKDDTTVNSVSENPDGGWFVRLVSGPNALPSENLIRPAKGYVGLWVKTTSANLKISVAIDNDNQTERGIKKEVAADGQWHKYEWSLESSNDWQGWINGDGIIIDCNWSLDSIQFFGPNADATVFIDDITHNPTGSILDYANCEEVWQSGNGISGDFNRDCVVDFKDLGQMASEWLSSGILSDLKKNNIVNFEDLAVFGGIWFECNDPTETDCKN
jgi:hypothetical protein